MSLAFADSKLSGLQIYRTPWGSIVPPYGRVVAYVRATPFDDDDLEAQNMRVASIEAALPRCKSGRGDIILVMPGHTQNAAALTGLVAGTKIIGLGHGANRPIITWAATGSQWAINVADVMISGLKLDLGGANGVTKAIAITGADSLIQANHIIMGTSGTLKAVIGVEYGAGSDRGVFEENIVEGVIAGAVTDGVLVAAVANNIRIVKNEFNFAAATTSMVRVAAVAALGLRICDNLFYNTVAASTACLTFGAAASDGICSDNYFAILANGVASATGITFGAGCLVKCFQNFCSDEPQKSGVLSPVVVAT